MAAATNGSGKNNGHGGPGPTRRADGGSLGDRLPPQSIEAEMGVLGSILLDNEVLHEIIPMLSVADFYRDTHQLIYTAVRDMYDEGRAIDAVTLAEELERRGEFEKIGGDEVLGEIANAPPHSAHCKYYAQIVREKSLGRQLLDTATDILRDAYSNQFTAQELLDAAESKIFRIREEEISGTTLEIGDVLEDAMNRIVARAESGGHAISGVGTGLIDLDEITGGFQPGQLIILAARPSMGKTAMALNWCEHVSLEQKLASLFISLEMGHREIAERLLWSIAKVDGHKVRTGMRLSTVEMGHLAKAFTALTKGGTLFIDDTPARNMLQITATSRRLKLRNKISLIVADYIQLIDSEESRDSRQEQIAKISRRLKILARDMQVPVVALSQLNRAVESREDRRPRMADLRESGAIEQDADIVLLLHRPEYYDPNDQPGIAELIIAKNRNGATGAVKLHFRKNLTRFENLATIAEPLDDVTPY